MKTEWAKEWVEVMGDNDLLLWTSIVPFTHPENKRIFNDIYSEVTSFAQVKR